MSNPVVVTMTKTPVQPAWSSDVPDQLNEKMDSYKTSDKLDKLAGPDGKSWDAISKKSGQDIKRFAESTTAHGLKYAFSESSCRVRRLAWFLAFLVAFGYLSYQLVACSIDYYRYPVKTEYKLTRMNSMEFPTVTICTLNQVETEKVDDPQALARIYRVAKGCMWNELLNTTLEEMQYDDRYRPYLKMSHKDVMESVSLDIDDTFKFCIWDGGVVPCEQVLTPIWTVKGKCFKLNANATHPLVSTRAGSQGGFFTVLRTTVTRNTVFERSSYGFKVLLHHMYDSPDVDSQGLLLSPGFSYHVSFQADTIKYLPRPYKSQGDMYCSEYPPPNRTEDLSKAIGYGTHSLTACIYRRAYIQAATICGCGMQDKNCTLYEHLSCMEPNFYRIHDEATKTDLLGCAIPCTIHSYRPVISHAAFPAPDIEELVDLMNHSLVFDRELYLGLSLFFDDLILREQVHSPVYNSLSIMGMLGGNMGLLLGASLLTLAEFFEFVMYVIWHLVRNPNANSVSEFK